MKKFILIKGAYNLRDLGGYINQDGKTIKKDKIFRAGKLTDIPTTEFEKLKMMNLKSICDFRTTSEQKKSPDTWYNLEKINRYSLPIGEGRMDQPDWLERASMGEGKDSYLYKANLSYVRENTKQYKSFFKLLMDDANYPLLFHCTAGKDRTGFAAILLKHILGIDRKTIVEDYLLTNEYLENHGMKMLKKSSKKFGFDIEKIRPLLIADENYIQGAFDAIAEDYGTIDNLLLKALEIGEAESRQLKHILLED